MNHPKSMIEWDIYKVRVMVAWTGCGCCCGSYIDMMWWLWYDGWVIGKRAKETEMSGLISFVFAIAIGWIVGIFDYHQGDDK